MVCLCVLIPPPPTARGGGGGVSAAPPPVEGCCGSYEVPTPHMGESLKITKKMFYILKFVFKLLKQIVTFRYEVSRYKLNKNVFLKFSKSDGSKKDKSYVRFFLFIYILGQSRIIIFICIFTLS